MKVSTAVTIEINGLTMTLTVVEARALVEAIRQRLDPEPIHSDAGDIIAYRRPDGQA